MPSGSSLTACGALKLVQLVQPSQTLHDAAAHLQEALLLVVAAAQLPQLIQLLTRGEALRGACGTAAAQHSKRHEQDVLNSMTWPGKECMHNHAAKTGCGVHISYTTTWSTHAF
jgi:hypothetical protein